VRLPLVLAGLALLSACNVVMTEKPLFTDADAAGAPTLRPGVWQFFREPGCKVDVAQPFESWPDCSAGGIVGPGEIAGRNKDAPAGQLEREPMVLAAGAPRIAQVRVHIDVSAGSEASGDAEAGATVSVTQPKTEPYGYAAVRPTKFDDQGRIVAFQFWPVQCGPPPPKNKNGEDVALATLHPLPGIEMKPGDADCTTHSVTALRAAAKASEAWAEGVQESRWLRDGDK
jgi:hypothetical protein